MKPISRSISFSGDQEYANTFVAKACSLFEMFTQRLAAENLDSGSAIFPIDAKSYIEFSLQHGAGYIRIHAERIAPKKEKEIPVTARDVKCHWMKRSVREKVFNPNTGLFETVKLQGPFLFSSHGFGKIVFGNDTYSFFVLTAYEYGHIIALVRNDCRQLNSTFFEDNIYINEFPFMTSNVSYGVPILLNADFLMTTGRISSHLSQLAYAASNLQQSGFLFTSFRTASLDFFALAQAGSITNGFYQDISGYTILLGGIHKTILQKSRTKFLSHGVDQSDETVVVDFSEIVCGQSNTYYGGGRTGMWGEQYHGPCIFSGSSDFSGYPPSAIQDYVGDSSFAYIQGSTTVGQLYDEDHIDDFPLSPPDPPVDYDWYWFSTINSATIYLKSVGPDGAIESAAFSILSSCECFGPSNWPDPSNPETLVNIPVQSGCVIRELGACRAACLKSAKVIGGNRNVFFIVDYRNYIHDQFDYNVFVNFGSGFVPINADPTGAYQLVSAKDWSENGLSFIHNADGFTFNLAIVTNDAAAVVKNLLSGNNALHTDGRMKEIRFFRSKNYRWFAVYNIVDASNNDISGVYEFNGSAVSRVGDATGVEPVEIPENESYFLMQDKAYGSITGTFNRLVGFFYDKFHYLEMQSREEDIYKRFVIKNTNNEEIEWTEWGEYSFYETSEDCSVAIISHCAINGVSQTLIVVDPESTEPPPTVPSTNSLLVNFIDGPFEFETICRKLVYNFSIDIENGYTDTVYAGDPHAPELASPYYGPPDREPPYGRKQIAICYCKQDIYVEGVRMTRHRHHVVTSPTLRQGIGLSGDIYCMHRPGFIRQPVINSAARILYRNCRQQRGLDPLMEKQILTILALPNGYFYERITDEIGPVDPLLLVSEEYVTDTIKLKEQ